MKNNHRAAYQSALAFPDSETSYVVVVDGIGAELHTPVLSKSKQWEKQINAATDWRKAVDAIRKTIEIDALYSVAWKCRCVS